MRYHVEFWANIVKATASHETIALYSVVDVEGTEWGFGTKEMCERLCKTLNSIPVRAGL